MIVVHHLNNSRSQRILWLLEELGAPYEVRRYERDPATILAPAELRAVHPLGKSPVIVDGGRTVAESGAMVEYLVEAYGGRRLVPPPGSEERLRYTYWLHYAEGSAMAPLLLALVFQRLPLAPMPGLFRPLVRRVARAALASYVMPQVNLHLDHIEAELARAPWFAGDGFTAADIQMSFPLEAAATRAEGRARPLSAAWLAAIHARPAYRRALAKGGPYDYAG